LIIDIEGYESGIVFAPFHIGAQKAEDRGEQFKVPLNNGEEDGEHKCIHLIAELLY